MSKILVCGFYFHDNFGDDCFMDVLNKMFGPNYLNFVETSTLNEYNSKDLEKYDAIVVGGGDLINDFYGNVYEKTLRDFNGYKIAVGVGISFEDCRNRKYINIFDDMILRNKRDIQSVTKILGTLHTHYMPDLAFCLPLPTVNIDKDGKNVGVYLVGTMFKTKSLRFSILTFLRWLLSKGYKLHLVPMYNEKGIKYNDVKINKIIKDTFSIYGESILLYEKCNYDEFTRLTSTFDFAVCVRFHAHVFCTRIGIPFLSIPLTRKVKIYVSELPESARNAVKIRMDSSYNMLEIDIKDCKNKFMSIKKNAETIRRDLLYRSSVDTMCHNQEKIKSLISNKKKRTCSSFGTVTVDPEEIYRKYRNILLSKGVNHMIDQATDSMSSDEINKVSDAMCYDTTLDPSNEYFYGTRMNFKSDIKNLRDMVYYIHDDFCKKVVCPKINLKYMVQNSLKNVHRAGWNYSMCPLYYYSGDHGVFLDTYLDRTFGWSSDVLETAGVLPYTNFWVGFFHHTFETEFATNNCTKVFEKEIFKISLVMCKGIFCLTEYMAGLLRDNLKKIGFGHVLVKSLFHPTIFVDNIFNYQKFESLSDKKLINVGSWYRNPITIYRVAEIMKDSKYCTFNSLKGMKMEANFPPEKITLTMSNGKTIICDNGNIWTNYYLKYVNSRCDKYSENIYIKIKNILSNCGEIDARNYQKKDLLEDFLKRINIISHLKDDQFDLMMSNSIIFLDLIDSSAVNTLIEIIVRKTPVLVNKIKPTVEIMGEHYPLFYEKVEDIKRVFTPQNLKKAHEYIGKMDSSVYKIDYFVDSLLNSEIYKSL